MVWLPNEKRNEDEGKTFFESQEQNNYSGEWTDMKLIRIEDKLHADLLLLKAIHSHKNLTETIRYEMNLAKHDRVFLDHMFKKGVVKEWAQ